MDFVLLRCEKEYQLFCLMNLVDGFFYSEMLQMLTKFKDQLTVPVLEAAMSRLRRYVKKESAVDISRKVALCALKVIFRGLTIHLSASSLGNLKAVLELQRCYGITAYEV